MRPPLLTFPRRAGRFGSRAPGRPLRSASLCAAVLLGCLAVASCRSSGRPPAAPRASAAPARWSDDEVRSLRSRLLTPVAWCVPQGVHVRIPVVLGADGSIQRVGPSGADARSEACIDSILGASRMAGAPRQSRNVILGFDGSAPPQQPEPPSAPAAAVLPAEPMSDEAAARAAVESRAAEIQRCVGGAAVTLQISWTPSGRLDALARDPYQGVPEESCIREVVQRLSIPRPGRPGSIEHELRR